MYRHEAIGIARKVMAQCGITDELKPWVVDAMLQAANGTARIEELKPFAWFTPGQVQNGILHQTEKPTIEGKVAMYVEESYVSAAQSALYQYQHNSQPVAPMFVPAPKLPIGWRREWKGEDGTYGYEWYNSLNKPAANDGPDWQPVYAE